MRIHVRVQHVITILCIAVLTIAALKLILMLVMRAVFFWNGVAVPDASLYWTIGRAILNGYVPYADIYENKPPVIFLLSAFSFRFFGNPSLGYVLNALMLVILPSAVAYTVWRKKIAEHSSRWIALCIAGVGAGLIMLYSSSTGGPWQTEYFGSFFGSLYALFLWSKRQTWNWMDIAIATLLMVMTVGFKEPFFFSLLGIAMLLATNKNMFLRSFIIPLAAAAVAGTALILAFGYDGYFTLHLRAMFGYRVTLYSPLYLRPFLLGKLLANLGSFSIPFALSIVLLIASAWRSFLYKSAKTSVLLAVIRILSFFVAYLSVGIGGDFQTHHFVCMVPYYIALLLLVIGQDWKDRFVRMFIMGWSVVASFAILALPVSLSADSYATQSAAFYASQNRAQAEAAQIDAVLKDCNVDRYFFMGPVDPFFAWTQHTPFNFFPFSAIEQITRYHPLIVKKSFDAMGKAQIIVLGSNAYAFQPNGDTEATMTTIIQHFLQTSFTTTAPPCVMHQHSLPFLFRTNPGDTTPPMEFSE